MVQAVEVPHRDRAGRVEGALRADGLIGEPLEVEVRVSGRRR